MLSAGFGRLAVQGAYYAQHEAIRYTLLGGHRLAAGLFAHQQRPEPETVAHVQRRYRALLEQDLRNARLGHYPEALLFQMPLPTYLRRLPTLARDIPRVLERRRTGNYRDLPSEVALDPYPSYYRRTFHWQSDGYLSARSAKLYDLGVEFVFLGCGDVMRRQVIPPLVEQARAAPGPKRVLDVGCGTGRLLKQLVQALPDHDFAGVDLSPFYLAEARRLLGAEPSVALLAANAEELPFRDAYFDAVVSVYLLHELPRNVRRNVLKEARRVLRPGGLLVLQDSAQHSDAPDLAEVLAGFGRDLHEPFHADYLRDDLSDLLAETGFRTLRVEPCFVAKVVVARR